MKKVLSVCFCLCALCALSVPALASADGAPPRWAFSSEEEWREALAVWEKEQVQSDPEPEPAPPPESSKSTESAGENDGPYMDENSNDKYPVGSYVDSAGQVWSPSGQQLSPDAVPDPETVAADALPPDSLGNTDSAEVPAVDLDTLSDIATSQPVWYVEDLRPEEAPVEILDGLKALVTSIFGEYTPVTTTSVVTETVGNDVHQYLVETVAPGAAGVDYEWLAGVFLFGILLFCLMKLLGGVLK